MDHVGPGDWRWLRDGVEVAVATSAPNELLGVRDGIRRYFHSTLRRSMAIAVVPHEVESRTAGMSLDDDLTVAEARRKAASLYASLGSTYQFYIAVEGGLQTVEAGGSRRTFVRSWAVVFGLGREAWGGSGSLEIPSTSTGQPGATPGTRRRGGLIQSITGGVETRRSAVALSTFHAFASLFFAAFEGAPTPTEGGL